jgi:hypothetical protein
MWAHFETMQVIQKPTYASMYFPGQALFLLLGKVATGCMWAGVVLSAGLMCMAICWALQGWLPPGWALFGGLIAVFRFALFSYWINSYWGGAPGALGGALVLGAFPRISRRLPATGALGASLLMGLGIVLLAVTRPFEGAIVCVPAGIAMLLWLVRLPRSSLLAALGRVVAPIVCVLAAAAALLGYYNYRVTGAATRVPYAVNQQTYGWPLTLPWFAVQPHTHSSKPMHDYFLWEAEQHEKLTDMRHHLFSNVLDGFRLWTFFAGPALTVFLVFLPWALADRRVRLPAFVFAAGLLAVAVEQSRFPHYFAPATAAFLVLLLQSARHLRAAGARSKGSALAMVRFVPIVLLLTVTARAVVPALRTRVSAVNPSSSWCCSRPGNLQRAEVVDRLKETDGQHLVIVRYGPLHKFLYEWVYNDPGIDEAKIVWARDMGEGPDGELVRYFAGRHVWLLLVNDDQRAPELRAFSPGSR